ncbi:MAG: hypothetical protein MZU91_06860 [Desulfosudis oleivorans]|nr:hypothetical protein [Desulfosudis oleivorans]
MPEKSKPSDFLAVCLHTRGRLDAEMGVNPKKSVVGPDGQCHAMKKSLPGRRQHLPPPRWA